MSKYSDFKEWMAANTAKTDEEKMVLVKASLGDGSGEEMHGELELGREREDDLMTACLCITYADHVTAKMQQEIDALKAEKLALELARRQWNAMFHQLDAVIGAALIDKENWQDWLESYMDNADTPHHLYTDAAEFHRNYTMEYPITIEQHKADIARLNAVFAADVARGDQDAN